jgi:hypothetical protein
VGALQGSYRLRINCFGRRTTRRLRRPLTER